MEKIKEEINRLGMLAEIGRQQAIDKGLGNENSYYHGKIIAYKEILNLLNSTPNWV